MSNPKPCHPAQAASCSTLFSLRGFSLTGIASGSLLHVRIHVLKAFCRSSSVKRRNTFFHFQRKRLEKGEFVCCHLLFPPSGNGPICRCLQIVCDHLFCTGLLLVLLFFYWRTQWSTSSVKKPQLNKTFRTCHFMRMGKLT